MMEESNVGFVFFTSGSTGEPKTVNKTSKCVVKESQDLAEMFKFSPDTKFVSTVTTDYMYGTTFMMMLPLELKCEVDSEQILYPEDIKDYEKFVFVSTPSFLEKLYKYNFTFKHKPEMIFSAGAKLDDKVFEYLETISKSVTEIYGSTEAGVIGYRQKSGDKLKFFPNVKAVQKSINICNTDSNTQPHSGLTTFISSPYFDEPELELNDELEIFDDGFIVKGRNDRIVKIQEKRISLIEMENFLNQDKLIEKSRCLKIDDKLCTAVVLTSEGKKFLEKNGKLELVKKLKQMIAESYRPILENIMIDFPSLRYVVPKRWRFLQDLPVNKRGKVDDKRIREWFNSNVTYPDIVDYLNNGENVELDLIFPKNSNFFQGHFPEFPILPGVVQLFFANEFSKDIFNIDFIPEKTKKIKFSSIIKPDTKVKLVLTKGEKSIDYKYVDCENYEKIFSSGTFVL